MYPWLNLRMRGGAREVAQWVRALTDLPEDRNSVPNTQSGFSQLPVAPVPQDLTPSSGLSKYCVIYI